MKTTLVSVVVGMAVVLSAVAQGKTGTAKPFPAQVAQIQEQIQLLKVHPGASSFLTIQEKGGEAIIQLARIDALGKRDLSLNIAYYPSTEQPGKALAVAGVPIPTGWRLEQFEAKSFAIYRVPESDVGQLPQVINDIFIKFFKCPVSHQLVYAIETGAPPVAPDVKATLGTAKDTTTISSKAEGQVVAITGRVTTMRVNGTLTEAQIQQKVDGTKTAYSIFLDAKGKALANTEGKVQVKGRIEMKDGKPMLVVSEFMKEQ